MLRPAAAHDSRCHADLSGVRTDDRVELDRLVPLLLVTDGDIPEPRIRRAFAESVLLARSRIVELTSGLIADDRQPVISVAWPVRDERAVAHHRWRPAAPEHARRDEIGRASCRERG